MSSPSDFAEQVALICECGNPACDRSVQASVQEYETIRQDPACFLVAPSDEHYRPDVEHVLEHRARYWVVEATETPGERAMRRLTEEPLPLRT